jgi:hypothetical protein
VTSRRALLSILLAFVAIGCDSGPRALVLIDGSPESARTEVAARADAFAKQGRAVQVLRVDPKAAGEIAARGEGEAAIVPIGAALGDFIVSGRGRNLGIVKFGGVDLRVLEVDGKLHPKVDGAGAHALAESLAKP